MNSIDNFLVDVVGNIVGNTLTDNQKMQLLESLFRMVVESIQNIQRRYNHRTNRR